VLSACAGQPRYARRLWATAVEVRCTGVGGWNCSMLCGMCSNGCGGRLAGSVRAARVASSPGAVRTWRARESSLLRARLQPASPSLGDCFRIEVGDRPGRGSCSARSRKKREPEPLFVMLESHQKLAAPITRAGRVRSMRGAGRASKRELGRGHQAVRCTQPGGVGGCWRGGCQLARKRAPFCSIGTGWRSSVLAAVWVLALWGWDQNGLFRVHGPEKLVTESMPLV